MVHFSFWNNKEVKFSILFISQRKIPSNFVHFHVFVHWLCWKIFMEVVAEMYIPCWRSGHSEFKDSCRPAAKIRTCTVLYVFDIIDMMNDGLLICFCSMSIRREGSRLPVKNPHPHPVLHRHNRLTLTTHLKHQIQINQMTLNRQIQTTPSKRPHPSTLHRRPPTQQSFKTRSWTTSLQIFPGSNVSSADTKSNWSVSRNETGGSEVTRIVPIHVCPSSRTYNGRCAMLIHRSKVPCCTRTMIKINS